MEQNNEPVTIPEYEQQEYFAEENPSEKPPKKHKRLWIPIIIVLLVLLCAAVLLCYGVPRISLHKTGDGFVISVAKEQNVPAKLPEEQGKPVPPQNPYVGSERQLEMENIPTLPGEIDGSPGSKGLSLQGVYNTVTPGVITVSAATGESSETITGIVLTKDGYLLTNARIVTDNAEYAATPAGGETLSAALVGKDELSDLAVFKIEADNLNPVKFGNSNLLTVGDTVFAIGSPVGEGIQGAFMDGIVSGISTGARLNGKSTVLLQTSASTGKKISDGPLINQYGQIIGLNSSTLDSTYTTYEDDGLGFAIPIAEAKPIIEELIEKGYVSGRPAIGITVEELPRKAMVFYNLPRGAYVAAVDSSSDAFAKGLREGDIITALEEYPVTDPNSLLSAKNNYSAGDSVTLTVYRRGDSFSVTITLMDQVVDQDS